MKIKLLTQILFFIPLIGFSQSNWTQLFNGKNFDGWEIKQGQADFEILNDGIIQATSILNSFTSDGNIRGILRGAKTFSF